MKSLRFLLCISLSILFYSRESQPPSETSEVEFHQIIDEITDLYRPVFEHVGINLVVFKDWGNDNDYI
jgi:hypothetical protein